MLEGIDWGIVTNAALIALKEMFAVIGVVSTVAFIFWLMWG
jgi:hypothetical protein